MSIRITFYPVCETFDFLKEWMCYFVLVKIVIRKYLFYILPNFNYQIQEFYNLMAYTRSAQHC